MKGTKTRLCALFCDRVAPPHFRSCAESRDVRWVPCLRSCVFCRVSLEDSEQSWLFSTGGSARKKGRCSSTQFDTRLKSRIVFVWLGELSCGRTSPQCWAERRRLSAAGWGGGWGGRGAEGRKFESSAVTLESRLQSKPDVMSVDQSVQQFTAKRCFSVKINRTEAFWDKLKNKVKLQSNGSGCSHLKGWLNQTRFGSQMLSTEPAWLSSGEYGSYILSDISFLIWRGRKWDDSHHPEILKMFFCSWPVSKWIHGFSPFKYSDPGSFLEAKRL